ncbi:MAG: hypothetical protein KKG75_01975 [Nanoarchaeota archaeon]|nr:hypothetical protein [Nanoarchaeota archaeon]
MPQNRKKLLDLLIGNLSNVVVHDILCRAVENKDIASRYEKETENSFKISKKYREKINPKNTLLQIKDLDYIRTKTTTKAKSERKLLLSCERRLHTQGS